MVTMLSSLNSQKASQTYDVIIVGGGPAGLAAARSAAENGAKTLVVEEHREIGLPHHCSGWLWSCPYAETLFALSEFKKVILQKLVRQRIFGPSGTMLMNVPLKGWVVNRAEFDKVLARRAIQAGADIVLSTRVASLLTDEGKIKGVLVESANRKVEFESRVVIGADGTRSMISGVAKQAGLAEPRNIFSDVQVEFCRVAGLEPGVTENYFGSFCGSEFSFLAPTGKDSMMLSMGNLESYEIARNEYPPLMSKLKKAVPLSIFGGLSVIEGNRPFKKLVKDGLLLAGDASGYSLIMRAMITGSYAGGVAARAAKEGDVSAARLSEYDQKRTVGNLDAPDPSSIRELLRSEGIKIGMEPHALKKEHDDIIEKLMDREGKRAEMSGEVPGLTKMELVE
jgi:digeranylgeranylglycerophospholipid reductase